MRRDVAMLRSARYIAWVGCPSTRQSHGWTPDNLTFGGSIINRVLPLAEPTGRSAKFDFDGAMKATSDFALFQVIFGRSNIITVFLAASNPPITG